MDATGNVLNRKRIVTKDNAKTSIKFCELYQKSMIGPRSPVPGTLHPRIVGVDMAKKPEDAKHIAIIDRVDEPQYSELEAGHE